MYVIMTVYMYIRFCIIPNIILYQIILDIYIALLYT